MSPPLVVLCTELHVCADDGHLDRDKHSQRAHKEAEAKDVVEVALQQMLLVPCQLHIA